ncbi:MAG: hypothetical protein FD169_2092 [Bacillota bacterium]|nr:MAG: hypothetical protein FD169_2092 [Bacillota bacterium]
MTMLSELNLTDARKGFSALYDDVYNSFRPTIVTRKNSEEVLVMRADLQRMVLSHFSLQPQVYQEDDGSVTLALDELDLFVNATTADQALTELINDMKAYAQDYLERSQLFLHAPNRRGHFPYVLRIMLCENDQEIRMLLEQ